MREHSGLCDRTNFQKDAFESVQITFQNSRTLKTEFLEPPLNHCAERVNHSKQMLFFVNDQHRVYFVLVQYLFYLCDFGVGTNLFGRTCHDVGHGEFEKAAELWQEVLVLNTNYEIAYNGIGKYYLREGEYKTAVERLALHLPISTSRANFLGFSENISSSK